MFVLLTKGKEKSIVSTPSTREANKNNSTKSHSLSDSPFRLTLEVQVSVIFTKTTNYETLKTILFAQKISSAREGFGGGGDHTYRHDRVSVQVDDLKWFLYNLLEFSLPSLRGRRKKGRGRRRKGTLSPLLPLPFFLPPNRLYPFRRMLRRLLSPSPFRNACHAG